VSTTLRATLAIAIAVATPRLAEACSVCLGGTGGGTSRAFAIGTLFLSVLPLAVIGTAVWYFRRRAKQIEHEESERRALRSSAVSPG
jgi:hypothetical protein